MLDINLFTFCYTFRVFFLEMLKESPIIRQPPMSKCLGNNGKEKLSYNRKKPPAESGSTRVSHLL